jgi:hypothetical protein
VGDAADMATEIGMDALLLHQSGECDTREPCQYCAEYNDATHKQTERGSYGGVALCNGRIPFGMVWEWARVTCKDCLQKRKR